MMKNICSIFLNDKIAHLRRAVTELPTGYQNMAPTEPGTIYYMS